jgi:hypothetical protein
MKDSKIKSLVESFFNILVGFSFNFVANMFVLPLFGMPFSFKSFGIIGVFYTLISLFRSFLIRRLFVNGFYETIFGDRK